jgi:hypothetical protein
MKDARIKKLKELMARQEKIDPASIVQEKDDSGKYSVENPEKSYSVPGQIRAAVKKVTENTMDEPEVEQETDDSGEIKVQSPKEIYEADPEIMNMMKKLKQGKSLDDEDQQVTQETIEDTSADSELRKAAIQKIKQKYLGR